MRCRSLYRFILRLHPSGFRKKYEDQMLWIFDESAESRGAVSLLFDALVSLVRQWVLRSDNWRHGQKPMAIDGASALAESLRRNSHKLFRKARLTNCLWLLGAFVVLWIFPMTVLLKLQFIGLAANAVALFSGRKSARSRPLSLQYVSLFQYKDSNEFHRAEIEARRDGLRAWTGKTNGIGGAAGIVVLFLILLVLWIVGPVIRNYLGLPTPGLDWDHSRYMVCALIVWALSTRLMTRVNERAAHAMQQELDAMVEPSMGMK